RCGSFDPACPTKSCFPISLNAMTLKIRNTSAYSTFALLAFFTTLLLLHFSFQVSGSPGQTPTPKEEGIPVTDPLVKPKCVGCHPSEDRGNMQRISWERATPEAWELVLQRMILLYDVELAPPEKEHLIQYLSTRHGLAPEEAQGVIYEVERRIR